MNRHARRAVSSKARTLKIDRVAAVHEAGHAVARFLVAHETGHPPTEAVYYIDVGTGIPPSQSLDGKATLHIMATTYGPWLPPSAEAFVKSFRLKAVSLDQVRDSLRHAESGGVNIKAWAAGRVFHIAAGGAAEAKFTGQDFTVVWNSYACEGDRNAAIQDCMLAGLDETAGRAFLAEHAARAVQAMASAEVWDAVMALSDRLPSKGRMPGDRAIAIIQATLGS